MKKIIALIVILLFINTGIAQADYAVLINGELIEFSSPVSNINGRTYAPARELAEYFGAQVNWHGDLAAVGITIERDEWLLFSRETLAYRNGRRYSEEIKAEIIDGRAMLPIRFMGELLDKEVSYEASTRTIQINDKKVKEFDLYNLNIMGESIATAEQMAAFLLKYEPNPKIGVSALELAQIFLEEGAAEGVRGDYAFAQSIHETGYFRYGGDVKPEQNNFAGMGAIGGGAPGNIFPDVRTGVRAQIKHLKCYASTEPLNNENVNPRWFNGPARGSAPTLIQLANALNPVDGFGWASPGYPAWKYNNVEEAYRAGETYGQQIHKIFIRIMEEFPQK